MPTLLIHNQHDEFGNLINLLTSDKLPFIRRTGFDLGEFFETLCDEIAAKEPDIQALVPDTFDREVILKQAEELQDRYADTDSGPPLFGLPLGVKDTFIINHYREQQ